MTKIKTVLYTAKAHATGGRDGASHSSDGRLDIKLSNGIFGLAARLNVSPPGMGQRAAEAPVDRAHEVCPHSRATRGNIHVAIAVATKMVTSQRINQTEEIHQ